MFHNIHQTKFESDGSSCCSCDAGMCEVLIYTVVRVLPEVELSQHFSSLKKQARVIEVWGTWRIPSLATNGSVETS